MAYTVLVAQDESKETSMLDLPRWKDVQSYHVWPPYQALEQYYPFQNSTTEVAQNFVSKPSLK